MLGEKPRRIKLQLYTGARFAAHDNARLLPEEKQDNNEDPAQMSQTAFPSGASTGQSPLPPTNRCTTFIERGVGL